MLANVMMDLDALPLGAAPVLIDAFLKGVLLLVVCSVAVLVLRRASAALRHLIWTIGLSGVLIMPVLNAVLPDWRVLMPMPVIARSAPVKDGFDVVIQPASEQEDEGRTPRTAHEPGILADRAPNAVPCLRPSGTYIPIKSSFASMTFPSSRFVVWTSGHST